jgi:DNA-binding response OmpR family regulator
MLVKIRRGEMPPSINRILIIDGDVAAGHVLELALGELGHLAESASTSSSAIVLARYFVPDIILVDIGLDNWDLPRALRAQRHVRAIMVTGCGEDDSRQRSFDAGFDEHLLKSDHLARIVNGLAA